MKKEGIKVEGHRGTWYVIDEKTYWGKKLYLVESEIWGDEAACLIIDKEYKIQLEDVWNGFEDYEEAFDC